MRAPDARRLLWVVVAEIALYVVLDAVVQALPPHYSPVSQAESDLAVGPFGYIMTVNFLNRGVLSLLFVYALSKVLRPAGVVRLRGTYLFGAWGVGALLLAAFPTDVPTTPVSWHGAIHLVVAVIAFIGGAFGAIRLSMQMNDIPALAGVRRVALAVAALAVALVLVDLGLPFVLPHFASRVGGLTERLFLGSVLLWIGVVSVYAARHGFRGRAGPIGGPVEGTSVCVIHYDQRSGTKVFSYRPHLELETGVVQGAVVAVEVERSHFLEKRLQKIFAPSLSQVPPPLETGRHGPP